MYLRLLYSKQAPQILFQTCALLAYFDDSAFTEQSKRKKINYTTRKNERNAVVFKVSGTQKFLISGLLLSKAQTPHVSICCGLLWICYTASHNKSTTIHSISDKWGFSLTERCDMCAFDFMVHVYVEGISCNFCE